LWNDGSTMPSINLTSPNTYSVTITNQDGCRSNVSKILYSQSDVNPSIFGSTEICEGMSTQLTASDGLNFLWNTGETTKGINVSAPGSYVVTITYENGCQGISEPFEVNVLPLPAVQIDTIGSPGFCSGDSVILRCNEAVAYLWNNGQTTREIKAFTSGSFQVTITGENNCKNKSEIIQVTSYSNPVPQLNLSGNISICKGDSVSLFTEEGFTYLWNTGENSQLINISDQEGSYWVEVDRPERLYRYFR
jgi:hypothetical protein